MLPITLKLKQPGATLMMALSAAFPLTAHAIAGRVDFAVGDVTALSVDGRSRPLAKGATIETGETVETGANGRVQLRFTDGAQVSLQPRSQFRIDDYSFSGKVDGSEKGFFSLLKGGLRTITGWVGRSNRDNYKVTTSVATIGIRGTEYSVTYGNSINVTTGEGIIEVCNAAGCLILNSGETAYVADANTQPVMTEKKADVPPPPPRDETQFSVAENTDAGGESTLIDSTASSSTSGVVTYSGFSLNGKGGDGSPITSVSTISLSNGTATFSGSVLTAMDAGGGNTATAVGTTSGNFDNTIGWGTWATAASTDAGSPNANLSEFHYITGQPTSTSEISALSGTTGNFSLLGATTPSYTNISPGTITGGSLTADFTYSSVNFVLNRSTGSNISGSGTFTGASFSGTATFTGSTASGSFSGFFVGTNAARAGLTYEIFSDPTGAGSQYGYVWGAAAFTR